MAGSFLQDLSEGIFDRLGELRKEQEAKDEAQKRSSIGVLSEAYKNAEPGGQQEILRLMGKVIGADKGKMKGFWNAFSGMPDRSVEDQLGTIMGDFSKKMVTPEAAAAARSHGDLARLFQGGIQTPEQQARGQQFIQEEKDLGGKIIFRNPREEELAKIRARGEVAEQVQADRLNLQSYYQNIIHENDARHREELKAYTENLRSGRKLRDEASNVAMLQGRFEPTLPDFEAAAVNLQRRGQLDENAKQELINFRQAATAEKKANVKAGKSEIAGQRLGIAQRGEIDKIQKEHGISLGKVDKAKADQDSLAAQIEAGIRQYAPKAKFNRNNGVIEGDPQDASVAYQILGSEIKDYRNKSGERAEAEKEALGSYTRAGRKAYAPFVKRGKSHLEPMEIVNPIDLPPPLEPKTPPTKGSLRNVGIGSERPRKVTQAPTAQRPAPALGPFDKVMRIDPNSVMDGQVIIMNDGKSWKITGKGNGYVKLSPYFGQ